MRILFILFLLASCSKDVKVPFISKDPAKPKCIDPKCHFSKYRNKCVKPNPYIEKEVKKKEVEK